MQGFRLLSILILAIASSSGVLTVLAPIPSTARGVPQSNASNPSTREYCTIQVPSGSLVKDETTVLFPDGTVHVYHRDRCLGVFGHAPTINGWVEYGGVGTYPTPATYMRGYWRVPAAPSNWGGRGSGQLNYLFNSIQGHDAVPPNTQWIAQPVLTYGCYNNGWFGCNVGGGFWWIASWLVWANGNAYISSQLQVSVGNQIAGQVSWYANSNCSVGYAYYIKAINQTPNPPIVKELAYCPSTSSPQGFSLEAGVLEVRGITSCNQLPNQTSITFGPVYTTPSQSAWPTYFGAGAYQSPTCSWGHSSTSDSVTLYWRP